METQVAQTTAEQKPKASAGRTIARNTAFGFASQMSLRVVGFIFQVLVVRRLGGDQLGQYAIVLAWAGLFSVLGDLGITQYFTREVARSHEKNSEYFWDVVLLRIILAIFASAVTTIGAIIHPYPPEIVLGIFLYTLTYLFSAIQVPLAGLIAGNERLDITSVFDVIGQVIFLVTGSIFLFAGFDYVWLVVASFLNFPVLIFMSIRVIRRNHFTPPKFKVNTRHWLRLIAAGLPFGFIQLALSFSFQVDTIILSNFVSTTHVGWYNIAYSLVFTFMTITRAFNVAILPTLARQHAADPEATRPWYYRSVKMIMFLSLPIATGITLISRDLANTLYGSENLPAAIILAIIIWDLPFLMYNAFCGNLSSSIRAEKGAARIYVSLAIFNVVVNLILIPRFGVISAAFVTVLTDMLGAAQFYLLFRHSFGAGLGFKHLRRLWLAVALMGVIVYFLSQLINFILVIPIAAVSYLALTWFLKAFKPDEKALLTQFAGRITGKLAKFAR